MPSHPALASTDRGELALDLANSAAPTRSRARTRDLSMGPAELRRWLDAHHDRLGDAGDDVLLRLIEFRGLHDALRELFLAASTGAPLPRAPVERLNALSATVPLHPELDLSDPGAPVRVETGPSSSRTAEITAAVARSAIDLLGSEDGNRLCVCAAPRCGRIFVAGRPRQVWCSTSCGNRARVARHQTRVREGKTSRVRPA